jgi:hypothetical protein
MAEERILLGLRLEALGFGPSAEHHRLAATALTVVGR